MPIHELRQVRHDQAPRENVRQVDTNAPGQRRLVLSEQPFDLVHVREQILAAFVQHQTVLRCLHLARGALQQAGEASKELGIEVVDVRVKQINLPQEVSSSIFARMEAERHAVAREHRSKGMEEAEIIRADVDARVTVMLADAERNSRTVRGDGDAIAANVYADAYNKNAEFFSFVRSMEAYRKSFNSKDDVLVVQPDNDFFKYMKSDKVQN